MRHLLIVFSTSILLLLSCKSDKTVSYDTVINHARIIDPESQTDAIHHIGIIADTIAIISNIPLKGTHTVDGKGMVLSPGFIDMHTHSPTTIGTHFQLRDGVTTALELEAGAYPVTDYGELLKDNAINHYGASVGYIMIRTKVLEDREVVSFASASGLIKPGRAFVHKATPEELKSIKEYLILGLRDGGIGIGLPLDYITNAVTDEELNMIFEVASNEDAPIITHVRRGVQGDPAGLEEMIDLSKQYKVSVHICHITANAMGEITHWLERIDQANQAGADISTEMYPYPAGSAPISSDVFNRDWQNIFGISYGDVQWAETGEFLTKETFENYKETQPMGLVIHHYGKEEWLRTAIQSPMVLFATDAMPLYSLKIKVTPRGIGTYSKILGTYVRELGILSLPEAIARMSYLPAKRLEKVAPLFKKKGRIAIGADADLVLFDPEIIAAKTSYQTPFEYSIGISDVWVSGQQVVKDSEFVPDVYPGEQLLARQK